MRRTVTPEELATPLSSHREVRAAFLATLPLLPQERMPLDRAAGRVLAETVRAPRDVPAFDSSAVDGYAVSGADLTGVPMILPLRDASSAPPVGGAIEVMTGWPMPIGTDTAVPWEITERDGDRLTITRPLDPGSNRRPAGEDLRAGDVALSRGALLSPLHIAVAASIGRTHLRVGQRPRVAIASTGDEVTEPGSPLTPASVYDANGPLLAAMVRQEGGVVVDRALLSDDPDVIETWLRDAAEACDLIVTSGGASVGVHDHLRDVVARLGSVHAWRLDVKPGKPVALGRVGETMIVILPGNPAGAFVGGMLFVSAAVRAMQGASVEPVCRTVRLTAATIGSPERTSYLPVTLFGNDAIPLPGRSSAALSGLAAADGFAVIVPGGADRGAEVEVVLPW